MESRIQPLNFDGAGLSSQYVDNNDKVEKNNEKDFTGTHHQDAVVRHCTCGGIVGVRHGG
jgi:hypothetical protein